MVFSNKANFSEQLHVLRPKKVRTYLKVLLLYLKGTYLSF